jgi:hypothetical protein
MRMLMDTEKILAWWERSTFDDVKDGRHLLQPHDEREVDRVISYTLPALVEELLCWKEIAVNLADTPEALEDAMEDIGWC